MFVFNWCLDLKKSAEFTNFLMLLDKHVALKVFTSVHTTVCVHNKCGAVKVFIVTC